MTRYKTIQSALALALATALCACGNNETPEGEAAEPTVTETAAPASNAVTQVAETADSKPAAFAQCAVCHKVDEARHSGIGPHLIGVFGAAAGSRGDYAYSTALKNSGITWDDASLDAFIASPQRTVSGTKMAFGGVADEAKRKEIIEYLKGL
ncbi:c-type cytochrome [Erythrobacteraceae bacterium E2-1 Yellow Sea]|nr:c-type cytochrome [Erythrobacteraceae bacterium E2-1 Yellow Sea]